MGTWTGVPEIDGTPSELPPAGSKMVYIQKGWGPWWLLLSLFFGIVAFVFLFFPIHAGAYCGNQPITPGHHSPRVKVVPCASPTPAAPQPYKAIGAVASVASVPVPVTVFDKREWARRPENRAKAAERAHRDPAHKKAIVRAWEQRNKARVHLIKGARSYVAWALEVGILTRATACEECGDDDWIEAAHSDYNRPLQVRWLCKPCHRDWDCNNPKSMPTVEMRAYE